MFKTITPITAAAALLLAVSSAATAQDAAQWQGFYGGAQLDIASPETTGVAVNLGTEVGGSLFGGYNHALNDNWVVGAELSYGAVSDIAVSPGVTVSIEDAITVRGRAGYAFGNALVYGSLGYTDADFAISTGGTVSGAGASFGLGVETMLTESLSARIEYNRTNFDLDGTSTGINGNTVSMGLAVHF